MQVLRAFYEADLREVRARMLMRPSTRTHARTSCTRNTRTFALMNTAV